LNFRVIGLATFSDNILSALWGYNHLFSSVHLWTISYEEQFYLILPWIIGVLVTKSKRRKIEIFVTALMLLNFIRAVFIWNNTLHPAIWVLPITHFESVLGGLALGSGVLDDVLSSRKTLHLWITVFFSIVSVVMLPNIDVGRWSLILTYSLTGTSATLLVYLFLQDHTPLFKRVFVNKAAILMGKISYGLYVYHLLCLSIANYIILQFNINPQGSLTYTLAIAGTGLALTLAFAVASYNIYEKPFLLVKKRVTFINSKSV
jgi:peptidoglycan/LPS O-acetylase OafA/YrhL